MTMDIVHRIKYILNGRTMLSEREQLLDAACDEIKRLRKINHRLMHYAAMVSESDTATPQHRQIAREIVGDNND